MACPFVNKALARPAGLGQVYYNILTFIIGTGKSAGKSAGSEKSVVYSLKDKRSIIMIKFKLN